MQMAMFSVMSVYLSLCVCPICPFESLDPETSLPPVNATVLVHSVALVNAPVCVYVMFVL